MGNTYQRLGAAGCGAFRSAPAMPQGLEDELDRADWQSSSVAAQPAASGDAGPPPALPPPPPAAGSLPPPPPTPAKASAAKSGPAGDRSAASGSKSSGDAVTVSSSAADRKRGRGEDSSGAGSRAVTAVSATGPAHGSASKLGNGAGKPPLALDKRKRKDSGLDEPMYRRAEAAIMDRLWYGPQPFAWAIQGCAVGRCVGTG